MTDEEWLIKLSMPVLWSKECKLKTLFQDCGFISDPSGQILHKPLSTFLEPLISTEHYSDDIGCPYA